MYTNKKHRRKANKLLKVFLLSFFLFSILLLILDLKAHASNFSNRTNVKVLPYQKSKVNFKNGLLYISLESSQKVTNVSIYNRFAEKIGGSVVQTNCENDLVILLPINEPNYNYVVNYEIENGNVIISFIESATKKSILSQDANGNNKAEISQLPILKR